MNELIQQARELCEKATPGTWEEKTNCYPQCNGEPWGWIGGASGRITWSGSTGKENATFIAASRTLVPQLCDALESAQKETERLNFEVGKEFTCFVGDPHRTDHCEYADEIGKLTARAEKAEAERDAANKCIYDTETYFDLGTNKFAYRTIKQYTHDAAKPPKGDRE